jgi:hypothetical protein
MSGGAVARSGSCPDTALALDRKCRGLQASTYRQSAVDLEAIESRPVIKAGLEKLEELEAGSGREHRRSEQR